MTTLALDTHKAVKTLREAGFEETQAEAMVATFGNAMSENVATKADIAELKAELKTDMLALEQRLTVRLYPTVLTGGRPHDRGKRHHAGRPQVVLRAATTDTPRTH